MEGEVFASFLPNINAMVVLLSVLLGDQSMGKVEWVVLSSGCNACKGLGAPGQGTLISGSERPCKSRLHCAWNTKGKAPDLEGIQGQVGPGRQEWDEVERQKQPFSSRTPRAV